jgi:hypothetical protein
VREQRRVGLRDLGVVVLDRDRIENRRDEEFALAPRAAFREVDPEPQLGDRDRGDREVVIVADGGVERAAPSLGIDQDRGVEDQSRQGSVTVAGPTLSRSSRRSWAQSASGGLALRASLTALPFPAVAGPIVATARPRRMTT